MTDSAKAPQSIDLINALKLEVQSTIEQVKALPLKSEEVSGHQVSNLMTKVNALSSLLDITRNIAIFEGIDRRIVAMTAAGENLRAAFDELTKIQQNDPKAKEWIEGIIKAWDDAAIK